jgi:dCMP deaminase
MKKKCSHCGGKGYTLNVINSGEVFAMGDDPITEKVSCKVCWVVDENHKKKDPNKWDDRFMGLAKMVSTWSKDKGTGVGAVIVDDDKKVVSLGYNGFPRSINDDVVKRHESPEKHHWTIHAERSAILEADISLKGTTLYCTFFTCSVCAQEITQKGIKRVVAPRPDFDHHRYGEGQKIAMEMYQEAGVEVTFYEKSRKPLTVFWKIGCGGGKVFEVISDDKFFDYIEHYKKKLTDDGVDVEGHKIDEEHNAIEIILGEGKNHYLYFGDYEVNEFIYKRD